MCQTGGEQGLDEWKEILEKEGYEIVNGMVVDDVCDNREMAKVVRKNDADIQDADAIVTLSCGLGVQSTVEVLSKKHPEKKVFVTNNTE
ncbi:MAG: hypothetical protein ACFFCM_11585, partial [Promethearchaeota archaeon]